jgi:hypothetical protein
MTHAALSLLEECRHPMRIDLIAVAGSGMSGLALLATQSRLSRERRSMTFVKPDFARKPLHDS